MEAIPSSGPGFMRLPAVISFTGLSKSTLYLQVRAGTFPSAVRVGARAVAWRRSEVKRWAAERVATHSQ
jgi:prophage regulatory protein